MKIILSKLHNNQCIESKDQQTGVDTDLSKLGLSDFSKCQSLHPRFRIIDSHDEKSPRNCLFPSRAACLIVGLLVIMALLPVMYILHCFGLTNNEEIKYVVKHHSVANIRKEANGSYKTSALGHLSLQDNSVTLNPTHHPENYSSPLPDPPIPMPSQCSAVEDNFKFDCYPGDNPNEEGCRKRGCCWEALVNVSSDGIRPPLGTPFCFYPEDFNGYKIINTTKTRTGNIIMFLQRFFRSPYPDDVPVLRVDVIAWKENIIRMKIYDPSHIRYEPPVPEVPAAQLHSVNQDYTILLDGTSVEILHKRTKRSIIKFDTESTVTFANQFLQGSMLLPAKSSIYGLGEHRSTLKLSFDWQRFTMFNHDTHPQENVNLYGSHPFLLVVDEHNSAGIFLLNSNAMEVILQPTPAVTFRTIGGILDFFVFMGPSPTDVVQQYQDVIGRPIMPPYWGLGYHLCRFGYKTLNYTKEILENIKAAGIPIDTQWLDLDYMNDSNDFTYDKKRFADLPEFVEELHKENMHFVPLIDPGISAGQEPGTYPPYDTGLEMDIFVKNSSGKPFVGKVWNRVSTVWPDFTNPSTTDYWLKQFRNMHGSVAFDGAWIDMNEPSNFYSGSVSGCPVNDLNYPPYVPAVEGGSLFYNTLCMSAKQYQGSHYDLHNLYGLTEAIATNFALAEIRGKRPFIISRSSFPGLGRFAGHWSGDIHSSWYDMKKSISELLSFSLFAIPLMGADICGFNGNTTVPLCQRWSQLGAFYPFSRNHNTDDGVPQDPVSLGPAVEQSARKALLTRYRLLPYLYTLFWRAHVFGDTVARPLFFEFPHDETTHDLDEQFLWGSGLMIVPVLEEGATVVTTYLPAAVWYDFYNASSVQSTGNWYQWDAPLDTIPLLIRGGSILPAQTPNMTTAESRKNDFELIVAADENGTAMGSLYWDDGDTLNTYENGQYTLLNFTLNSSVLNGHVLWCHYYEPMVLGKVLILGVPNHIYAVSVNNETWPFSYDESNQTLVMKDLKIPLNKNFTINWT